MKQGQVAKQPASIFNDVIGPVMRGPSSSHTAAALRIGRLARQLVAGDLREVLVEFDRNGSLATTYHGQGSDIGFAGGLMGYEPWDDRLVNSVAEAAKRGIAIRFAITEYGAAHPNTYRITVSNDHLEQIHLSAISVGGGMMEIQALEGFPVRIGGDCHETLLFLPEPGEMTRLDWQENVRATVADPEACEFIVHNGGCLLAIKTSSRLDASILDQLQQLLPVQKMLQLEPILPVRSAKSYNMPFRTLPQMVELGRQKNLALWELAVLYESARAKTTPDAILTMMGDLVRIMSQAIETGLQGTTYADRILGFQAGLIGDAKAQGKIIAGDVFNTVISYITAIMEVKSSMGVVIAAPTAGSCGCLPGTIIGTAREMARSSREIIEAMLAAGLIGVLIAESSGFAAEVGGCQLECGAASGMAAAGLVQLMGGSLQQCIDAAAIALQNVIGMVCDPVADRVEVPCLGKNIMAGVNAIACANMALSGFDKVIPLDEVIEAIRVVGGMLPAALRCTGKAGLSVTPTARLIQEHLAQAEN